MGMARQGKARQEVVRISTVHHRSWFQIFYFAIAFAFRAREQTTVWRNSCGVPCY